jgi:predicted nucleotidyltransferase component of viral defense system
MDSIESLSESYRELYELQDRVLNTVFEIESDFYLTRGTCLSRFYQAKRYSDDLVFFTNDSPRFSFAVRAIKAALQDDFLLSSSVETKNFVRMVVDGSLQIDFVNDAAYRPNDIVVTPKKYRIDTVENILSNKLTAVIGRDNPKDIFDIVLIHTYYPIDWPKILQAAHRKAYFSTDDLIIRLTSFPKPLLNSIQCIDCEFLQSFDADMSTIIQTILNADEPIN